MSNLTPCYRSRKKFKTNKKIIVTIFGYAGFVLKYFHTFLREFNFKRIKNFSNKEKILCVFVQIIRSKELLPMKNQVKREKIPIKYPFYVSANKFFDYFFIHIWFDSEILPRFSLLPDMIVEENEGKWNCLSAHVQRA